MADRSEQAEYVVDGEWLSERVDRCTCAFAGAAHDDRCGWEPRARVADVAPALAMFGWVSPR
jgi:hypothetical protein